MDNLLHWPGSASVMNSPTKQLCRLIISKRNSTFSSSQKLLLHMDQTPAHADTVQTVCMRERQRQTVARDTLLIFSSSSVQFVRYRKCTVIIHYLAAVSAPGQVGPLWLEALDFVLLLLWEHLSQKHLPLNSSNGKTTNWWNRSHRDWGGKWLDV